MKAGELGKVYQDGELVIRQGEVGNSMYVIQTGEVEISDYVAAFGQLFDDGITNARAPR